MNDDLTLAHELADLADSITLPRFHAADLVVERKPDQSFVTEADRRTELALRDRLARDRPADGVIGEEFGAAGGEGSRRWILDPIDGTHNYLRGVPIFATLIALEADGDIVMGVASAPALGRRWWAVKGQGARADGRPLRVSSVDRLEDASISSDSIRGFERLGLAEAFLGLARKCWRQRAFGDFWQHMLVAEGALDIVVEPDVALWDLAASQIIVEEAGGRFTDLSGAARPDGGSAISSNGLLHDAVLAAFGR